jgi:hypothetical protein
MAVSNERSVLARYFCCLITSKFAPEDVIAWCQDEWRAAALERAVRAMSAFNPKADIRKRE